MNNVLTKRFVPNLIIDDFIEECKIFAESYSCSLCEGILYESVIDKCGHSFCKECSITLLKETSKCPFTHMELSPPFSMNIIVNSVLEKLIVYCKNKKNDCNWQGKLSERKEHLNTNCTKEVISCENAPNCKTQLPREQMIPHLNVCPYRIIECEFCEEKITFMNKDEHNKQCPNILVNCSNNCGMQVKLSQLTYHLQNECDNTITECPFSIVGCQFYEMRKQLKVHLNKELEKHLRMITNKIKELKNIINQQEERISNLSKENFDLKNNLSSFGAQYQQSQDKLNFIINSISLAQANYSIIPQANIVPNFYSHNIPENKMNIFDLNYDEFSITKITNNDGWYGVNSEVLELENKNESKIDSSISMNKYYKKTVINMKIINTANSCIMFGLSDSNAECPLLNGYYHQTLKNIKSLVFYCFNCSVYQNGIPIVVLEKEKKCYDGDIISMIIDSGSKTVEFRKNGKIVHEKFMLKMNMASIKVCVDLSDYLDKVKFLD